MHEFIKNIKCIWKYAKKEKRGIITYIVLSLFNIVFSVAFPFVFSTIIVNLTDNKFDQVIYTGIVILSLYIIDDTFYFFRNRLYEKIFREIYIDIQADLGKEILKLNNKTLEENSSGVFIQRLVDDTKSISTIFTDMSEYINGIVSNLGIIVSYFILCKPMFFFVLFALLVRLLLETKRIDKYNKSEKEYKKYNDSMTGFAGEIVRGAEDIKMLNGEVSFLTELKDRFRKLNNQKYEMENRNLSYLLVRWSFSDVCNFITLLIVVSQIRINAISAAVGVVIINFGSSYDNLIQNITSFHELIKKFNLSASRVFDIFDNTKYQKENFGNEHLTKINGDFEFKNVTFKYNTKLVLNDLSFKVNANETVAFVGKSGAGKTTIFNLLCKMYDNYDGTITMDGVDIKRLDKDTIRGNITIVSQNPYIFNMSIKDNLKLVKKDLTEEEMIEACKLACLDEYISSLPNKYDTIVGEGGVNLSGGEKQRLAIARAFLQKTEIILFDEASSALDNETQAKIQKAIDNLQKDYTILMIAHRLSTIQNADRILLLDDGRIKAEGTHKELLKNSNLYRNLYEKEIVKMD